MTKMFCDRCGKEIIITECDAGSTLRLHSNSSDVMKLRKWYYNNVDICPECEKSFEEWFMKGEKENG